MAGKNEMFMQLRLSRYTLIGIAAVLASIVAGCGGRGDSGEAFEVSRIDSPAAPGSLSPHLAVTPDDRAVLSWLEPMAGEAHAVRYSILDGDRWTQPVTIAEDDGWFVNWADVPSVVPLTADLWMSHWLVKRPGGTYSYDIAMSVSADGGLEWRPSLTPHTDGTATEHGFVSMFPWSGDIGAVWLDGRNMPPDGGGEEAAGEGEMYGGMTLRYARLTVDGATLEEGEIDSLVCDCCQTDIAVTASGPVVVYRDRTADEIRDISVARYADGGWLAPNTVSDDQWHIPACPVNGPAIAAAGNSVIVAWYANPKGASRIKVAWSDDAGRTFSPPILIEKDGVGGRVDVTLLANGSAVVSWIGKTADSGAELRMRHVNSAGDLGPVRVIAEGEYSRSAGFPQMIRAGDRLIYAWPEPGEPRRVLTATSPLADG